MADEIKKAGLEGAGKVEEQTKIVVEAPKPAQQEPRSTMIRVKCTDKVSGGGLWYQDGGIRIPKDGDGIKVEGPAKKHSWLEAQIQAGLVVIVKD